MPTVVLTDEQKVHLAIQPVTASGNPAVVDGVPEWAASDPAVVALIVAADGLSADATTVGPVGASQVSVSADADLGSGIRTISGVLDVQVVAAEAASLAFQVGTPEPK